MSVFVNSGGASPQLTTLGIKSTKTLTTYLASTFNVDGFSSITVNPVKIENVISTATYSTDAWNTYKATCTLSNSVTKNDIWRIFWSFLGAVTVSSYPTNQICGIFIPSSNVNMSVMSWG